MWKDKVRTVRDYLVKHSKIAFPVIVVAAVAVTVVVSLNVKDGKALGGEQNPTEESRQEAGTTEAAPETTENAVQEIQYEPLTKNEDAAMYSLMATYHNALANGDVDTIKSIKNYVEDTEEIRIRELSNYIESYPLIEIYTKPGPEENSYIAYVYTKVTFYGYTDEVPGLQTFYVCTDENGNLYLNEGEVDESVLEYIKEMNFQDDVVELFNRVNVECNDVYLNNSKLFEYVEELDKQVSKATGETLAAQIVDGANSEAGQTDEAQPDGAQAEGVQAVTAQTDGIQDGAQASGEGQNGDSTGQENSAQQGPVYATATTTVNMRSSDSEQADKVGKVPGSEQVQVLEQKANGWSKVIYDGKEGYIKSEYLQVAGAAAAGAGGESIGTITAKTNVNIRDAASETANKIGVVAGGDSVELLSRDNEWCQIRYNGQVGFVKAEYME